MIYLIDNGFGIKSALITLFYHVECPEAYNRGLGCKAKGKLAFNAFVNGDVNQGTCFADGDGNDHTNGNGN